MRVPLPGFRDVESREVRRAIATLRPALAGQGRAVAGAFVLALAGVVLELLRPWPIKVVLDRVILARGTPRAWGGLSPDALLVVTAVATALIPALIGLCDLRLTTTVAQVGRKVTTRIRRQLFEHLHRLALPFHQNSRTGDLLVRLIGDVNMVRDLLLASWLTLLSRGLLFVAIAVLLAVFHPGLALLALAPLPLLGLALRRSSRQLRDVTRKQRRREGDAAGYASESLRQIRVVKAYCAEDRVVDRFAADARSSERAGVKAARLTGRMSFITETVTGVGTALVLLVGARSVRNGGMTPGDLLVVVSYARMLYKPVRKVSNEGGRLSKAVACAGRIVDILDLPPEEPGVGEPAPRFRGHVRVRNLTFTYPNGARALDDLSLAVPAGELAVVAGPNGSGKSTLLSVLLRLVEPERGHVTVDRRRIDRYELASYRSRFAYVPQDLLLFGATVRENILYGRPNATAEEIEAAARLALFDEVARSLPEGYDTPLGEGGATLSGGQARRLMLARAAVRDASILLLDEPLAGIDPDSRPEVAGAIRRIAAGRTAMVVSHDALEEIEPDVVLFLRDGRLLEEQRPEEASVS